MFPLAEKIPLRVTDVGFEKLKEKQLLSCVVGLGGGSVVKSDTLFFPVFKSLELIIAMH